MTDAAIITGSAGGIGSAMVDAFRQAGYFVIGIDKIGTPEADAEIRLDLQDLVSAAESGAEPSEKILSAVGHRMLKVVINNAAVQLVGPVAELSVPDFRRTMDINVTAAYALIRICLDKLAAARGCVINIGSIHARLTKPGFSAYATSKGAIETLTRALAVEMGERIRVNAISPAAIDTPMLWAGLEGAPARHRAVASCHPTTTIGMPDEMARLALIMASEQTPFLNGAVVDLTGGISGRLYDPY